MWSFSMGLVGFMKNNSPAPLGGSIYLPPNDNADLPKVEVDLIFESLFRLNQKSFAHDLNSYGANLPEPGNLRLITINGINTQPNEQRQFAESLSGMSGGHNVHMVYNATHGALRSISGRYF